MEKPYTNFTKVIHIILHIISITLCESLPVQLLWHLHRLNLCLLRKIIFINGWRSPRDKRDYSFPEMWMWMWSILIFLVNSWIYQNESFYRDVYQSFNPSVNATEAAVLEFNAYNSITLQHDSYLCTAVDLRNKKSYIGKMFPINFTFV